MCFASTIKSLTMAFLHTTLNEGQLDRSYAKKGAKRLLSVREQASFSLSKMIGDLRSVAQHSAAAA